MPTQQVIQYTFNWGFGLQGWTFNSGTNQATGQLNPIDNGGCLQTSSTSQIQDISYWEWVGTWDQLNVPLTSIMDNTTGGAIQLYGIDTKVAAWYSYGSTVSFSDINHSVGIALYDGSGGNQTILWNGIRPGDGPAGPGQAEVDWTTLTTQSKCAVPDSINTSDGITPIRLRIYSTLEGYSSGPYNTLRWDNLVLNLVFNGPVVKILPHQTDASLAYTTRQHSTYISILPYKISLSHTVQPTIVTTNQLNHTTNISIIDTNALSHGADSLIVVGGYVDYSWDITSGYTDWQARPFAVDELTYSPGKANPTTYPTLMDSSGGLHASFNPIAVYSTHGPLPFGWILCDKMTWTDLGVPTGVMVTGIQLISANSWGSITAASPDRSTTLELFNANAHQFTAISSCPLDPTVHYNYPDTYANLYGSRGLPNDSGQLTDPYAVNIYGDISNTPYGNRNADSTGTGITLECILYPPVFPATTSQALSQALTAQALDTGTLVAQVLAYTVESGAWYHATLGMSAYTGNVGVVTTTCNSIAGTVQTTTTELVFKLQLAVTTVNSADDINHPGELDVSCAITNVADTQIGNWILPAPTANPGIHSIDAIFTAGIYEGLNYFGWGIPTITFAPDGKGNTTVIVLFDGVNLSNHPRDPIQFSVTVKGTYVPPPAPLSTPLSTPPPTTDCIYPIIAIAPTINTYNTGVDANHIMLPALTPDPHYIITASADKNFLVNTPGVVVIQVARAGDITCYPYGLTNNNTAHCIGLYSGGAESALGEFDYTTTFNLEGFDPATVVLSGFMLADDWINFVSINGNHIPNTTVLSQSIMSGATALAWTAPTGFGLQDGINTLTFHCQNVYCCLTWLIVDNLKATGSYNWAKINTLYSSLAGGKLPTTGDGHIVNGFDYGGIFDYARSVWLPLYKANNQAAFNQQFPSWLWGWLVSDYNIRCVPVKVTCDCIHPNSPIPTIVLYNTGVDNSKVILGMGAQDSHYTTGVSEPYTVTSLPKLALLTDALPISSTTNGDVTTSGDYYYGTAFNTEGFDLTSIVITGNMAAADHIAGVLVNNTVIAGTATADASGLVPLSIPASKTPLYVTGTNSLVFHTQVDPIPATSSPTVVSGNFAWYSNVSGGINSPSLSGTTNTVAYSNSSLALHVTLSVDINSNPCNLQVTGTIGGVTMQPQADGWIIPVASNPTASGIGLLFTAGVHTGKYYYDFAGQTVGLFPNGNETTIIVNYTGVRVYCPANGEDCGHPTGPLQFQIVVRGYPEPVIPRSWVVAELNVAANIDWLNAYNLWEAFLATNCCLPTTGDKYGVINGFDYGRIWDYARTVWYSYYPNNKTGFLALFPTANWLWDWLVKDYICRCPVPPPTPVPPLPPPPPPATVTIPGFTVALTDVTLRIFYNDIPPVSLTHDTDAWVSWTSDAVARLHYTDANVAYADICGQALGCADIIDQWSVQYQVHREFDDSWDVANLPGIFLTSTWSDRYLVREPLTSTWAVYKSAGTQLINDQWADRVLVQLPLKDTWSTRRLIRRVLNDVWKDRQLLDWKYADEWAVRQLVVDYLRDNFYVFPPSEYKPKPYYNLHPLADVLTRRCATRGFNTHRFVELIGGEIIEPTAFEPDPVTHRSMYYYNTTTNRLYLKVLDRYEPEIGIVVAHWKGISN